MIGEASRSYTWTFAICPNRIGIDLSVIGELQQDIASTPLQQQGLLYGTSRPGTTEIHGRDPLPVFGREEFGQARSKNSRQVLGYYVIREGSAFVLSDAEIGMARECFRNPASVVLLIERRTDGPAQGTFFFWRGDAFVYNLPVPFPIDAALLAGGWDVRALARETALAGQRNFAYPGVRKRRGRSGLIAAAAVAIGVLLGGWWAYRAPDRAAATDTISLAPAPAAAALPAQKRGDLEISWDPLGPAISTATAGVLQIDDGGIRRQIPLTLSELRFGSVVYSPATDRLRVALSVRQLDGSTFEADVYSRSATAAPADSLPKPESIARSHEPVLPPPEKPSLRPDPSAAPPPSVRPAVVQAQHVSLKRFSLESALAPVPRPPVVFDPHDLPPAATPPLTVTPKLPAVLAASVLPAPVLTAPVLPAPPRSPLRSGRIIWTGTLPRRGVVELDGKTVSVGSLAGTLPGAPVSLMVYPAEFSDHGLVVYITDASRHNKTEPPSAGNGWNRITYEWDPERVRQLTVLEAPNASNKFNRLALRSDARRCTMILIDWATK